MKRFTETEKWRDSWFRRLHPSEKLAYLYIVDCCDNSGVWDPDYELAEFQIGHQVAWPKVIEAMGDRLEILKSGKWHLRKFVGYQFGELSDDCKPHQHVIRLLESHGIERVSKGYPKGIQRDKDKDKDKDQDQDKDIFTDFWAAYPRKVGKGASRKSFEKLPDKARIVDAARRYSDAVSQWPKDDLKFVPNPATWLNQGRFDDDPATWERTNDTGQINLDVASESVRSKHW